MKNKVITVKYLARVEGEGAFHVTLKNNQVVDAKLRIFEPPRFFEGFLQGRDYTETPDITARICGICPVAYQMSACHAIENACGVQVTGQLRNLRRLLYCGEWIESHALHIYMLHAPDFLGYDDAIRMAKDHPDAVQRGLRLKKTGNKLVAVLGGREIHPINVRVGGFYRIPDKRELISLIEELQWARQAAAETISWVSGFEYPDYNQDYEFVSLQHPDEYPMNEGRIVSSKGLDIPQQEYENHFVEKHVKHSSALQSIKKTGGMYVVGPLARYNLNYNMLTARCRDAAKDAGLGQTCNNPFQSIIVRSIETLYACEESLRIIHEYERPPEPFITVKHKAAVGQACTEAPRGMLYHRYTIKKDGKIRNAKIVAPTSQNQKIIETDLRHVVEKYQQLPQDKLQWKCEQSIRNYDPCISCSAHFLKLKINR